MDTRQRSPSYPSTPLPEAIDFVRKLHAVERTNPVDREVAAVAMGYSGITGRSATVLSNLLQFGLLTKTGKNEVRVSQRAIDILYPDSEPSKAQALREAAAEPELFQRITERFTDGLPSPAALEAFLIRQGFTHSAIAPAKRAFFETFLFLENAIGSDSHLQEVAPVVESQPNQSVERTSPMAVAQQPFKPVDNPAAMPPGVAAEAFRNVTKPIFDFETVGVWTVIDNRRDLRELIGRLEKLETMLPDRPEKQAVAEQDASLDDPED